jgi:hypothetical protein
LGTPSAAISTIRARCAAAAVMVCDRAIAVSLGSSPTLNVKGAATDTCYSLKITP